MKFNLRICVSLSALIAIGLASCGPSTSDKEKDTSEFNQADTLKSQLDDMVFNMPPPSEIPYLIQGTGAEFNESLINPRSKADQYAAITNKAALNLGVYAADIGYLVSYDKTQDAIDHLNSAKTLADGLGVIGSFDLDVLNRFEKNISQKDSLTNILNETVKKTEQYLKDDNRNKLSAMIVAGSFVEGLYIATGLVKTYPKDLLPTDAKNLILTPIIKVVLDQKKSVPELVKMLSNVDQDEPVASLVKDLKDLEAQYTALNIDEQIQNNKGNLAVSDKNLIEITNIVERLRKTITD